MYEILLDKLCKLGYYRPPNCRKSFTFVLQASSTYGSSPEMLSVLSAK